MRLAVALAALFVATPAPAARIVSLAPNVTELAFAAGAGGSLVGVSAWSDYPAAARDLPRIGDAFRLDYERIVALAPDLAITWESGTPAETLERLRDLGVRVVELPVYSLENVASAMETLGRLAGTEAVARSAAARFRDELAALEAEYRDRSTLRVFVQIDDEPLFTVTGRHLISQMMSLCGGRNVFAGLPGVAPVVDLEAVLAADPEVILYTGMSPDPASRWRRWERLAAVRAGGVFSVDADLVTRATPRAIEGAREVCEAIDQVRSTR